MRSTAPVPFVQGIWRFDKSVTPLRLQRFAQQMVREDSGYTSVYIRRCGRDAFGIGFLYRLEDSPVQRAYRNYFARTRAALRKGFRTKLTGWDLGAPLWLVK